MIIEGGTAVAFVATSLGLMQFGAVLSARKQGFGLTGDLLVQASAIKPGVIVAESNNDWW